MLLVLKEFINYTIGSGFYVFLWIGALVYIFLANKRKRASLFWPAIIIFVIFINPLTIYIICKFLEVGVYSRVIWCLCSFITVAFAMTDIIWRFKAVWIKVVAGVVSVALLVVCGSYIYIPEKFELRENLFGISEEAMTIASHLSEYYSDDIVIIDEKIIHEIPQFDSTIKMSYGRWNKENIVMAINDVIPLEQFLKKQRENCKVSVIVLEHNDDSQIKMMSCGWYVVENISGYDIYKYAGNNYIMSNYLDSSCNQGMFYTFYNYESKKLICVDSGWIDNADKVSDIISKLGGHVDAWILTHFDNDHVDAFNEVYARRNVSIDKIYITPLDYDYYLTTIREWDTPLSYSRFIDQTKDFEGLVKLKRGDELKIEDFDVKVFNAYDDVVKNNIKSRDLPNNASLVLKMSRNKDSILFCGDCHDDELADIMYERFGNEMKSEYVQCGHHGNNSFSIDFYKKIEPKAAFFDAPQVLIENDKYTFKKLQNQFAEICVENYDFSKTTINSFLFE